jgi:hypothetical protein
MYYILNERKKYIAKYVIFIIEKKYYIVHKYTQMRIENRIKLISDENEYEKVLNYLLVKL